MIEYKDLTHQQKTDIALRLSSPANFYVVYFEFLPAFDSPVDCFDYLNEIHNDIYRQYRYSCYDSFRVYVYRTNKKYKK